ncbi:MAG: ammonia-forming cytochrome c nitrite reductase subunit c552 [Limisphaerales bacterium]
MANQSQPKSKSSNGIYFAVLAVMVVTWGYVKFAPEPKLRPIADAELTKMRPQQSYPPEHAPASDCRECHEHNHQTWFDSYHRTMTQDVKPETVLGDFDDVTVDFLQIGNAMHLTKRDGMPWVSFDEEPDVTPPAKQSRKEYPLVMSTGSHHIQFYWFPVGAEQTTGIMPIGHLVKENRWIPLQHSFLSPPSHGFETQTGLWNSRCVRCHTTFPEMQQSETALAHKTRVTEYGISCEACHGPAGTHVAIQRNAKNPDPNFDTNLVDQVVNPENLTSKLSTAVCASCHSIYKPAFWKPHIAGQPLGKDRRLIEPDKINEQIAQLNESIAEVAGKQGQDYLSTNDDIAQEGDGGTSSIVDGAFWPDGKPRVTGGDYNSLLKSTCFTKGDLSCVSCHKLHQSRSDKRPVKEWANDQLKASALGNSACTQCHEKADYESPKHTHHQAGSGGSSCYNCHMPYTSYGLLTAIRSHTIYSPNAKVHQETGRPTACNLCHLDQTLEWTADHLEKWYDIEKPEFNEEEKTVSNAAVLALRGDASQRALVAYAMGWGPAMEASDTDWVPAYLATLLKDPYAAVRHIAGRSLKRHPGYADIHADFVDMPPEAEKSFDAAMKIWLARKTASTGKKVAPSQVLLKDSGELDAKTFKEFYDRRDNREITIVE